MNFIWNYSNTQFVIIFITNRYFSKKILEQIKNAFSRHQKSAFQKKKIYFLFTNHLRIKIAKKITKKIKKK